MEQAGILSLQALELKVEHFVSAAYLFINHLKVFTFHCLK